MEKIDWAEYERHGNEEEKFLAWLLVEGINGAGLYDGTTLTKLFTKDGLPFDTTALRVEFIVNGVSLPISVVSKRLHDTLHHWAEEAAKRLLTDYCRDIIGVADQVSDALLKLAQSRLAELGIQLDKEEW